MLAACHPLSNYPLLCFFSFRTFDRIYVYASTLIFIYTNKTKSSSSPCRTTTPQLLTFLNRGDYAVSLGFILLGSSAIVTGNLIHILDSELLVFEKNGFCRRDVISSVEIRSIYIGAGVFQFCACSVYAQVEEIHSRTSCLNEIR